MTSAQRELMSKENTGQPRAFVNGVRPDHYKGLGEGGKRLATVAKNARKRRIDLLYRKHRENKRVIKLAAKFSRCSPKRPCLSPSCPSCHQAAQEAWVAISQAYKEQHLAGKKAEVMLAKSRGKLSSQASKLAAVTIVTAKQAIPIRHLGSRSLAQVRRWFTDKLAKARVRVCFGVLEVVVIEHEKGRYEQKWLWHLHGIIEASDLETLAERLLEVFPASDIVPRPIKVVRWNGKSEWPRYCYKSKPRVRIGIDSVERFNVRTGKTRKCRSTSYRALSDKEFREYLLFMDSTGLGDRIITVGAQLRASSTSCKLVKMRRPRRQEKAKTRDAENGKPPFLTAESKRYASGSTEKGSRRLPGVNWS